VCGMHSTIAGFVLPTGYAGDFRWLGKGLHEHTAIHVISHRQTEQGEKGRSNVEQGCTVDSFVLLYVRAFHAENSEWPVLHSRTGRFSGDAARTQVIGVEPMIRNQQYRGVRASEIKQGLQHHVMESICAVHY